MVFSSIFCWLPIPAEAQDVPLEPAPHLVIEKPVPAPEPQIVPRTATPLDKTLQDSAVKALNDEAATISEACDTPLDARIDWSTIDPQDLAGNSAANACGAVLTALQEACNNSTARAKVQAEIKGIICTAGNGPALDLRAGTLIYTLDWQSRNPAVFIYSWLLGNL